MKYPVNPVIRISNQERNLAAPVLPVMILMTHTADVLAGAASAVMMKLASETSWFTDMHLRRREERYIFIEREHSSLSTWFATIILILIALAILANFIFINQASAAEKFDHFTTGFSLDGGHTSLACDSCHVQGQFKGTPRLCESCHNNSIATGKPANHIGGANRCADCHTTRGWQIVRFDHS